MLWRAGPTAVYEGGRLPGGQHAVRDQRQPCLHAPGRGAPN